MAALSRLSPSADSQLALSSALHALNSNVLFFPKYHSIYSFGIPWQAGPRPESSPPALTASGKITIRKPAASSRITWGVWKLYSWLHRELGKSSFFFPLLRDQIKIINKIWSIWLLKRTFSNFIFTTKVCKLFEKHLKNREILISLSLSW